MMRLLCQYEKGPLFQIHQNALFVGFVTGSSKYVLRMTAPPLPCRLDIIPDLEFE